MGGVLVRLEAPPQLAAGYPLIPLKATVTALGCSLGWDGWRDALLVWDGWVRGRGVEAGGLWGGGGAGG